jgi:hypothetical protein
MRYLRRYEKFERSLNVNLKDLCLKFKSMEMVISYLEYLEKSSEYFKINSRSDTTFNRDSPIYDEFSTEPGYEESIFISGMGNLSYGFIIDKENKNRDVIFNFYNIEYDPDIDIKFLMKMNKFNL